MSDNRLLLKDLRKLPAGTKLLINYLHSEKINTEKIQFHSLRMMKYLQRGKVYSYWALAHYKENGKFETSGLRVLGAVKYTQHAPNSNNPHPLRQNIWITLDET